MTILHSRRAAVRCACMLVLVLLCVALSSCAFFDFGGGRRADAPSAEVHHAQEVDYYKVLQLEDKREEATEKDIRQQFRRLSRLYHPDVAKTEEDKAKYSQVNRAYEVLSDKRKRKVYDMRGERGLEQLEHIDRSKDTPGGGMNPLARLFGMRVDDGLRGPDMELEAKVDLAKLFTGGQETLQVNKQKVCHACKGNGADTKAAIVQCRQCGGEGVLRQRIQFAPGMIQELHQKCPSCGGAGRRPERLCSVCRGNKLDLDTSLTLTLQEALVGFDRNITHLDGVEQVRVQRLDTVSPYGTVLRLPGKGMPKMNVASERGDLYVRLQYDMPAQLTEEQRKLVEMLL
ncbi:DnaJ C terminal domain family protein [Leishmania donovani]|uniref:DnaJ C terminal domain family protein n=1 Tax=Leishmania donovani TaxID=5661 RepID=A0A504XEQ4_LEIDO|nr:DnaJ C terminal domain family protein [Leishmania donovani]